MKRLLVILRHSLWYAVAGLLISAAILVTAARLALPDIGEYKDEIQLWISQYMGYPLQIERISAEWKGWTPELHLENIDLLDKSHAGIIAKFDSASIGIDLYQSLINKQIRPQRLTVSGLNLQLTHLADGSISISNRQNDNFNRSGNNNAALAKWLLQQQQITLVDADIGWKDEARGKPVKQFRQVTLELRNDNNRMQLYATSVLPPGIGELLELRMNVAGNLLTPDWDGDIYLMADKLKLDKLTQSLPVTSKSGSTKIEVWTHWDNARLVDFSGNIDAKEFVLGMSDTQLHVETLSAQVSGKRQQRKNWLLKLALSDVKTENGDWPTSVYELSVEREKTGEDFRYVGYASYLKLDEVIPCLQAALAGMELSFPEELNAVRGELSDLEFSFSAAAGVSQLFTVSTQFNDLSYQQNPYQINGLSGKLQSDGREMHITLDSDAARLGHKDWLEPPLLLDRLSGNVDVTLTDTPIISIDNLLVQNTEVSLSLDGDIELNETSPFVDLLARLEQANLESVTNYLPRQMYPELQEWLKQALVAGNITSADIIYRGNVDDFPFEDDSGIFKAIINVENATIEYERGWPYVDRLNAEVMLDNDDLLVFASSGYIFDAEMKDFNGAMKNITQGNHHLRISGRINGHTSDARLFIEQSPLQENPTLSQFAKMNITGNIGLDMQLDIPLGPEESVVNGNINFIDTTIESGIPELGLEQVNGNVKFTRHHAWAKDIDALYHGKPVKLEIPEKEKEEAADKFILRGLADKSFILSEFGMFFPALLHKQQDLFDYFDGESEWSVTIQQDIDNDKKIYRDIRIASELDGISIDLPYPLGKPAPEKRAIIVDTRFIDETINEINIEYGDLIYTDILIDNRRDLKLEQVNIGIGEPLVADKPAYPLFIKGDIDKLNINAWLDFLELRNANSNGQRTRPDSLLLDLQVSELMMFDQHFQDTGFRMTRPAAGWTVELDGAEIKGQVQLLAKTLDKNNAPTLAIALDYLIFDAKQKDQETNVRASVSLDELPEIDASIKALTFYNKQLGETRLLTSNVDGAILIETLSFKTDDVDISASGKWSLESNTNRSEFDALIKARSLADLLSTFGYDGGANIDGGKTRIELSVNWMDTPINFAKEKAYGELDMNIGKGQFPDISAPMGSIFGLLSVATLPRRLTLDFSDLFKKGFAFDRIDGSFTIDSGNAYTNNLSMTAPAADIVVTGRTGLIEQDYDQIATVLPKISSTLPVAGGVFGPIGIGVGAAWYLANKLFDDALNPIDKIVSYQYSIKGSWENPAIEKLSEEEESGSS